VSRIEREAIETMRQNLSMLVDDASDIPHTGTDEVSNKVLDKSADAQLAEKGGKGEEKKTATGQVGANDNHPEAQLWGIGETKTKSKL